MSPNTAKLRAMTAADLDRVWALEKACFTDPWSREAFEHELANHLALYQVYENEQQVIGYCGLWKVVDEGHITNLCIDPSKQGRGYGKAMMHAVIDFAKSNNICRLTLEVRVSNEKAISLYEGLGFVKAGLRKGYYENNGEDACIMWLEF